MPVWDVSAMAELLLSNCSVHRETVNRLKYVRFGFNCRKLNKGLNRQPKTSQFPMLFVSSVGA